MKYLPELARKRLEERKKEAAKPKVSLWPDEYVSSRTNKIFIPQNEQVNDFINEDKPRYLLLKGGEGGGKSAAGIIKDLNRLRRGMSGILVGPDLQHFKKSIWPTFREWCPWQCVIEEHRYKGRVGWEPSSTFILVFINEVGGHSTLICGGAKESEIGAWEGPNVNFVHFDEARRHKEPVAVKTFDGRARIPGPSNEPPQIYLTTTPRKHWLYDYFGPLKDNDKFADFKADSKIFTVITEDNIANLDVDFVRQRAQSLTDSEARILLMAEWEDESDIEKFVNMVWWDNCQEQLQPLGRSEACIIALDAAKGSENPGYTADCFAMVMVSRHPNRKGDVAIRYCGIWEPAKGQLLDFEPVENELKRLCKEFSILEVAYDPHQLHDMAMRLRRDQLGHFKEFNQQSARLAADKQLQDLIVGRRIAHDGNPLLRQHIDNSNIKKTSQDGIRLVKSSSSQKIDAAVSLSMAAARCLYYNF